MTRYKFLCCENCTNLKAVGVYLQVGSFFIAQTAKIVLLISISVFLSCFPIKYIELNKYRLLNEKCYLIFCAVLFIRYIYLVLKYEIMNFFFTLNYQ